MWGLLRDVSWSLSERELILNAGHTSWQNPLGSQLPLQRMLLTGMDRQAMAARRRLPKPDIKIRAPPPARPGLLLSRGRAEPLTPPSTPDFRATWR